MKKVVVKKYKDELGEKEWLKCVEVDEDSEGRVKLVDYEKLMKEMDGKVLSVRGIGKMMVKCSDGRKKKVYYSEVLGMLKRKEDAGVISVERRKKKEGGVIYYKISRIVKQ